MKIESQMNQTSQKVMFIILDKTRASKSQVSLMGDYFERMQKVRFQC